MSEDPHFCAFCATPSKDVIVLIAAPSGVMICDACVFVALRVIADRMESRMTVAAAIAEPPKDKDRVETAAHRMAALRQRLGWSQARMADHLGISQPTVCRLENGQPIPGPVERLLAQLAAQNPEAAA